MSTRSKTKSLSKLNHQNKLNQDTLKSRPYENDKSQLEIWAQETSCITMSEKLERSKWEASCLEKL